MSDRKKSITSWLKSPKLFKKQKDKKKQDDEKKHSVHSNRSPVHFEKCNNELLLPQAGTYCYSDTSLNAKSSPLKERNCPLPAPAQISDDFDLFVQLSNSPTSNLSNKISANIAKRNSLSRDEHCKYERAREWVNSNPTGLAGTGGSDELRRVMSMAERKPSTAKPTSYRRDLARASFRSRSVRERCPTKRLHYPRRVVDEVNSPDPSHLRPEFLSNHRLDGNQQHLVTAYEQCIGEPNIYRVRSFKVTNKGVVNLGDKIRARSVVLLPTDVEHICAAHVTPTKKNTRGEISSGSPALRSPADAQRFFSPTGGRSRIDSLRSQKGTVATNELPTVNYPDIALWSENTDYLVPPENDADNGQPIRIQIVGSPNVGKTSLCRQLITSDFLGARMESISEDTVERRVVVELDHQTWNITLIDNFGEAGEQELALIESIKTQEKSNALDAGTLQLLPQSTSSGSTLLRDVMVYLLVYSVDDARSYEYAATLMQILANMKDFLKDRVVILVANKSDLVRNRSVSVHRGKRLAHFYGCKYFEVSAAINHQIDELLVEIIVEVKHLRRKTSRVEAHGVDGLQERRISSLRAPAEAIARYFRKQFVAKSCEEIQATTV
ncbi:unnamed protein product [Calicophoron daubneyi]|uniref:G domain-containing protein n=1 Tax=Calicophoron daubneyi TaxID=300641 RepID=A0AAV2TU08_CALDB